MLSSNAECIRSSNSLMRTLSSGVHTGLVMFRISRLPESMKESVAEKVGVVGRDVPNSMMLLSRCSSSFVRLAVETKESMPSGELMSIVHCVSFESSLEGVTSKDLFSCRSSELACPWPHKVSSTK